jgi:uncharacterized protein (TIGR01777 family)
VLVAITGSHGLIGSALIASLQRDGHDVLRLVRSASDVSGTIQWDPAKGLIDAAALEGVDAVVHLAGEGVAEKKWDVEQKRKILESRTQGTSLLARTLAALDRKPSVLVSASAIGFYGDRGDEVLTEQSPRGDGFLADVVVAWEGAAAAAEDAGIRVAKIRTGIVLSAKGGALAKILLPFKLGLGGRLGPGTQWWSWVSIDDVIGGIRYLIDNGDVSGPVNLTGPEPVTNASFTSTLGKVLHRPSFLPTPSFAPRLILGKELAHTLLFDSQRVLPDVLSTHGYPFHHRDLESALRAELV